VPIRPEEFQAAFISEVSPATARAMAATQRPITLTALGSPSGVPAWRTIPSWYAVSGNLRALLAQPRLDPPRGGVAEPALTLLLVGEDRQAPAGEGEPPSGR
jgi:hypothetical protein